MNVEKQKVEPSDLRLDLDPEILIKAEKGDSSVQLDIGKAHYSALNQDNNCEMAFHWLTLSAEQNNMEAQFLLGDLYALGHGVKQSEITAYDWYLKSALQGYPKALTRLHNLYHVEKSMYCRGQRDSKEAEWCTADFKKKNNIRELNEYRVQQLETVLTRIKDYFTELLTTCREQIDDGEEEKMDNQDAYLKLGFLYQHGYGIRKIKNRAIEFYKLAAEKGNIDAQYNLGDIYHHSPRIKWNYREAFKWYTRAVGNGHIYAHDGLAFLFLKGLGTDINYSKAIDLYTKAAENRHVNAAISLATIFRKGEIVEQDIEKAVKWYRKAIMEGSTVAQNSLEQLCSNKGLSTTDNNICHEEISSKVHSKKGLCSRLRSDILKLTDSSDIEKLKKLATNAMKGDGHAMFEIGKKYYNGVDFTRDKDTAFKWIRNAAKSGLANTQCTIAKMYKVGRRVEQDYHKASTWYEKAAKKGNSNAQYNFGYMYHNGLGVRKDPLEASKWYTFAANKNNSDAQFQLGILRVNGEGLRQDMPEALKWFDISSRQKNPQGVYRLGTMYEHGNSVKRNLKLAMKLFVIAARLGSLDAQIKVSKINFAVGDAKFALKYCKMASNQGSPETKYELATRYLHGKDVDQDLIRAYRLFKESSDLGYYKSTNIFNVPIDYSKSNDIDYDRITAMFTLICNNGIDSLEYNLGYHYSSNAMYLYNYLSQRLQANNILKEKWYKIASDKGVSEAQYRLAMIYENSYNLPEAMKYYEKAYSNGNIDATYRLACMYLDGFSIPQDFQKAFCLFNEALDKGHREAYDVLNNLEADDRRFESIKKMLEISAESGNVISRYKLGLIALNNKSPISKIQVATKWLKMASDGGFIEASYRLALLFENNIEEEEKCQEIVRLYQVAADKGHEKALFRLAQLYHLGEIVEINYLKAFEYYTLIARQGFQPAQLAIDVAMKSIWETNKNRLNGDQKILCLDYTSCFNMWKYVAEKGNFDLQYKLGTVYEDETGGSDILEAVEWYSKAANGFHNGAIYRLARLYEDGQRIDQDFLKAIKLYERASKMDNHQALYQLGTIYQNGNGTQVDLKKAFKYFKKAAKQGSSMAQFTLGKLYEEGALLPQNKLEALKWHSTSALQENNDAENWLATYYDEAYNGDFFYRRKFKLLSQIAMHGDNTHQSSQFLGSVHYELGYMYFYGQGTSVCYTNAWDCFQRAFAFSKVNRARDFLTIKYENVKLSVKNVYLKKLKMFEEVIKKLSLEDLYELGSMYYHGVYLNSNDPQFDATQVVIEPNATQASKLFRMIIKRDLPGAAEYYRYCSHFLGMIHFVDVKRKIDSSKASYYLTNAFESGFSDSQLFLDYINAKCIEKHDETLVLKKVLEWHETNLNSNRVRLSYNLGWMYKEGFGTQQDHTKSVHYYTIAVQQDYTDAYIELGNAYINGYGVDQNYATAIEWYTKAANQNHIIANVMLGSIYFNGEGVEKNYKLALQYYKTAADQGNSIAQRQMGVIYASGKGVEQNYATAIEWYTKAADQNSASANFSLGYIYFEGEGVEKDNKLALQYFKAAAAKENSNAQNALGTMYENGLGVEQNYATAIEWYKKAAHQNNASANFSLGDIYFEGEGVEKDYSLAFQYLKAASDQGNRDAQNKLAEMYYQGLGIERDYEKAIDLYSQASSEIDYAMLTLGNIYHTINNGMQDFSKAFRCYESINESSYNKSYALRETGLLYEYGDGVEKDYERAYEFYKQAADKENRGAYYNLGLLYYYGKGVDRNFGVALRWFNRVIEEEPEEDSTHVLVQAEKYTKRNPPMRIQRVYSIVSESVIYGEAHYYLGIMYKNGYGIKKSHKKAMKHFKIAHSYGIQKARRHRRTWIIKTLIQWKRIFSFFGCDSNIRRK